MKKLLFILTTIAMLTLLTAGSALADFAWGTMIRTTSGYTDKTVNFLDGSNDVMDSIKDSDNDMDQAVDNMRNGLEPGRLVVGISAVDGSTSPNDLYMGEFSADQFKSILGFTNNFDIEGGYTSGGYVIWDKIYIDETLESSYSIRSRVNDGVVELEISKDGGSSWTSLESSDNLTYQEWLTKWNGGAVTAAEAEEAEEESREEKTKVSSRLTNQIISTRVLNVFSPRPKVSKPSKTPTPKKTPDSQQEVSQINTRNPFISGYTSAGGLSSGDDAYSALGIGVWSMGAFARSYTHTHKTENTVGIFMGGVDKLFLDDDLIIGLGFGYENSWTKLETTSYTENGEGYAISPYAAYRVTDQFTLKTVFNTAFNSYATSGSAKNYDGTRLMGDLSGDYIWINESWLFGAEAGVMYMDEDFNNGYTDVYLCEGRLSGRLGYEFENGFMPYFRGTFYQQLLSNSSGGLEDHTWEGTLGLNYYTGPWSFSMEAFDAINKDQNTYGGSLLCRFEF